MDELFRLHPHGVFLRREAVAHGHSDHDLARAVRAGTLVRVRQGTYLPAATWNEATPAEQHLLVARGVAVTHEHRVAMSHTTGALAWGLRLWEPDLTHVHVVRLDGVTGRRDCSIANHRDSWSADEIWCQDEHLVLDAVTCALQAALLTSVEGGVVVLDSVLDLALATPEQLWDKFTTIQRLPFARRLQIALRLARRGGQSVGESRLRYLFWLLHLPAPELQYQVFDGATLVGIADFAWPEHKQLGEFDGRVKYGRLLEPGERAEDAVFREKKREDAMREVTGFGMIRYTYGDLYIPRRTAERTRRALLGRDAA